MDTKDVFRCFEIKVSKSDFYSKAKHTFVGNYNYYVMPKKLYKKVKHEIPEEIGVYISEYSICCDGFACIKNSKRQELKVNKDILKNSIIRSLYREVRKQLQSKDELYVDITNRHITRLEKENKKYREKYIKALNDKCLFEYALEKLNISKDELQDDFWKKI